MTCEICAGPTSEEMSAVPEEDGYVTVVLRDEEGSGLSKQEFEFCSLEHARLFVPDGEGV